MGATSRVTLSTAIPQDARQAKHTGTRQPPTVVAPRYKRKPLSIWTPFDLFLFPGGNGGQESTEPVPDTTPRLHASVATACLGESHAP